MAKYADYSGKTDCIWEGSRGHLSDPSEGYTHSSCVDLCMWRQENATCGCTTVRYNGDKNAETAVCGLFGMLLCPFHEEQESARCSRKCKPQCDFSNYNIEATYSKFPSYRVPSLIQKLNPNISTKTNPEYWKKNAIDVRIRFSSLTTTKISVHLKYSFINTISAFGGLGGLFIGSSLITIVEIGFLVNDFGSAFIMSTLKSVRRATNQINSS
ncbi:epithelial sodium channel subunit gamma-like [Convolutriloba macropyga]|uniref:epithelial sodium channel subunit gamma-like n=1 Tax=Convolutriloba macropyga TaxID=536237 RepID=UPI003F52004B